MNSFQGHAVFHIEIQSTRKCLRCIFLYLLPTTFAEDYTLGSYCQKFGHVSLPNLASTDPPRLQTFIKVMAKLIKTHVFLFHKGRLLKNLRLTEKMSVTLSHTETSENIILPMSFILK